MEICFSIGIFLILLIMQRLYNQAVISCTFLKAVLNATEYDTVSYGFFAIHPQVVRRGNVVNRHLLAYKSQKLLCYIVHGFCRLAPKVV